MAQVTGTLSGPLFETLLQLLRDLVGDPLKAREFKAKNAPYACYYDQPTGGVTGNTIYLITQAQSGAEYYTEMLIVFEQTSGLGRYMVTADQISSTRGIPIASGASYIRIEGHQNIRNFRLMAEAGQTLLFARVLFR